MRLVFANGLIQVNAIGELSGNLIEKALSLFFGKAEYVFQSAEKRVLATRGNEQVLRSVVQLVAIAVMDYLAVGQRPTKKTFHNDAVLSKSSSASFAATENQVSRGDTSLAICSTLSFVRIASALEAVVVETAHAKGIRGSLTPGDVAGLAKLKRAVSALAIVTTPAELVLDEMGIANATGRTAQHACEYTMSLGDDLCV